MKNNLKNIPSKDSNLNSPSSNKKKTPTHFLYKIFTNKNSSISSRNQPSSNPNKPKKRKPLRFYTPMIDNEAKAEKAADSNGSAINSYVIDHSAREQDQIKKPQIQKPEKKIENKSILSISERLSCIHFGNDKDESENLDDPLRDFIGIIIGYYEKFNICNSFMARYEKKVSQVESLSEIFELLKEMIEELMENILKDSKGLLDCSDVSDLKIKDDEADFLIYQLQREISNLTIREKEIYKVSDHFEKQLKHKEQEINKIREKYDEVGFHNFFVFL